MRHQKQTLRHLTYNILLLFFSGLLFGCSAPPSSTAVSSASQTPTPTPAPSACSGVATTFSTGMNASVVVGQSSFTASTSNAGGAVSAAGYNRPVGVWVAGSKLYAGDANNNRVLVYNSIPTSNGVTADVVIGQPNFTTSTGGTTAALLNGTQNVFADTTYLITPEFSNSRITFWPLASLANGMSASYQWGQPDFVSSTVNNGGIGAGTLKNPTSIIHVGTKYIAADAGNNRVLIYDTSSVVSRQSAVVVIGQPDMTSNTSGSSTSQLNFPLGVASDGSKLIIVDSSNNRALIYNTIPTTNGAAADVILGGLGTDASHMSSPVGAIYSGTKLFISDRSNHRVLIWNTLPTANYIAADIALGQVDMISVASNRGGAAGSNTLASPHFLQFDGCRLYVADRDNHRILIY